MSNYAIVETGSKQYRVEPESVIQVEKLPNPEGKSNEIILDKVLLIRNGEKLQVGSPFVAGAKVICEFLEQFKAPKVVHFRYRRRKDSKSIQGHRQPLTRLKVKSIQL